MEWWSTVRQGLDARWQVWREQYELEDGALWLGVGFAAYLVLAAGLGVYWSQEPELFVVRHEAEGKVVKVVPGYTLASTSSQVMKTLLDKPGGYLSNDLLPPGLWLDNMPAWERGALLQVRDMVHALHRDMSLSHAQYIEDKDLAIAEPQFNFDSRSWVVPSTEGEYRRGIEALDAYAGRLASNDGVSAQFYARGEYLRNWLADVDVRLGGLSARLNAALPEAAVKVSDDVGHEPPQAEASGWSGVDDVFYESRGSAWALIHLLKAVEVDFEPVLRQHNALLSLRAAIHELEATQQTVWSPMILNGSGFGFTANHSLVMANYINRAHIDLQDVRALLAEGGETSTGKP